MEKQLLEIRDAQKASWDKFSPGWRKRDEPTMKFLHPHGEAIIGALELQPADVVLDVAAGTGP